MNVLYLYNVPPRGARSANSAHKFRLKMTNERSFDKSSAQGAGNNQVQARDTGHWDQIYATYWWRGDYLPGQKKTFFKGYSKKYGHNEAKDKEYLLISRVLMLQQHGYIDKCSKIEIHKRAGACCMANDPIVLTLFQDSFLMGEEIILNKSLYNSLKSIYETRSGSGSPTYVIPPPKVKNIDLDKEVKICETKQYLSLEAVIDELHHLQAKGVAEGQIRDLYTKILQRNPKLK